MTPAPGGGGAGPALALTVAGSDSGGGAGIQADLKTFHAFGVFGTSAVTAVTAQNTRGVTAVHPVPAGVVWQQIAAVAEDLAPGACKTGMLATAELVRTVARALRTFAVPHLVLDPVMVASSGDRLLDRDAEQTVLSELLPLATLVTPNLDEAALLTGTPVETHEQMRAAAAHLVESGAQAALVKGGHLAGDQIIDVLFDGREWHEWRRPRLRTRNTHGTGCTLSAAVAAGLAQRQPLVPAVAQALHYVRRAMAAAPGLGSGHGPLNHMVSSSAP